MINWLGKWLETRSLLWRRQRPRCLAPKEISFSQVFAAVAPEAMNISMVVTWSCR